MKAKLISVLVAFVISSGLIFAQKGLVNNGAKVIVSGGAVINISGGVAGNYTNKTSGTFHGRMDLDGKVKLTGAWNNNATSGTALINVDNDGEVLFNGNTAQSVGGSATTFEKLSLNNSKGLTLNSDASVNDSLKLTNGLISITSKNLTLGLSSKIGGTPSATKMIVFKGTGQLRKLMNAAGNFTFPVGDSTGTAEYSPVNLNFTSGTFGGNAFAAVNVTDAKHPNNSATTDYISRYWTLTQNNISSFSCNPTCTYLQADVVGNETGMFAGLRNGSGWNKLNAANTTANQLTGTITQINDITGGPQAMFCDPAIVLSFIKTDVSCFGGSNGAIDLSVTNGLSPFNYNWTTTDGSGQVNEQQDQSGLTKGTYNVTVTDANACIGTTSITIIQPAAITFSHNQTNVSCNGLSNAAIDLIVSGGTPNFTFQWSNNATTEDISGLSANTYTVTATDANSCSATYTVTITQPAVLTASHVKTDVSCNGGNNGAINLTPSGGTPNYSYIWSNGATIEDISALSNGTFTVTITDSKNCVINYSVTITQPSVALSAVITSKANVLCYNGNDGWAEVTATGGTPNYTYKWNDLSAQTTQKANGLKSGIYTVTVSDSKLCTTSSNVTITEPADIVLSTTKTDANCGLPSGSVSVLASGGTGVFTYKWSDPSSATTSTVNNLYAGTYFVTVTDANLCTKTGNSTILDIGAPTATISGTNITCFGLCNGTAFVSVTGGASPYLYNWSNGVTNNINTALCANNYSVTVTDQAGCKAGGVITISQPPLLTATIQGTNLSCFGSNNGIANLTVNGGTPNITYQWSNNSTTEDINSLAAGTYCVTVTDNNNCKATSCITITEPLLLTASIQSTNISCNGEGDGQVNLIVSGGTTPFTYFWSNGSTLEDISGLAANTYCVTVTDKNLCTTTACTTITEPIQLSASISGTNPSCNGAANGSANLTINGGTGAYSYIWSNNQTTQNIAGLAPGTYCVTVKDQNNCSVTSCVTLTDPSLLSLSFTSTQVKCNGEDNGAADLTVSGGIPNYLYLWSNAKTTEDIAGLTAGTYCVTVTDHNNCKATSCITITEPLQLVSSIAGVTNVSCYGGSDGAVDLTEDGGISPYNFNWSNSETTEDVSGLAIGGYYVIVSDQNNCSSMSYVTITQPLTLTASITGKNASCNGGSDGEADLTVSGGTLPYAYIWSNSATTENNIGINAGAHCVTVTDKNNCIVIACVTITEPAALSASITGYAVSCPGGNDGEADLSVSGGTGDYYYQWSNTKTTEDISGLAAGVYCVTVKDDNNCTTTACVTITQPAVLSLVVTETNVMCNGGSDGAADLEVSGGTQPFTYIWTNGATTEDISGLPAGMYCVTVTDINSCTATTCVTITEPSELTANITPKNVSCNGGSNGEADLTVSGGTLPYTYNWSTTSTDENISGLVAGIYCVTITDINNCIITSCVTITEPSSALSVLISSSDDISCFGEKDGTATAEASGGTQPYTYSWSDGQTGQTASGFGAGTYTVIATDLNACTASAMVTITEPVEIALTASSTDATCNQSDGSVSVSATGGVNPYTFKWNDPLNSTTALVSGLPAGIYYVTVSDINGCKKTTSVTINNIGGPALTISGTDVLCNGTCDGAAETTVTGGSTPYQYNWSNGQTTPSVSGLCAGDYTLTVTDASGCKATDIITISEPDELVAEIVAKHVTCFGASDGGANLTVTGGSAPFSYIWNPGGYLMEDPNGLPAGIYCVTVTDNNLCTITSCVTITQPMQLLVSIAGENVSCFGSDNGKADLTVTGGTSPFTYSWTNGASTEDINNLLAGQYCVTVTDLSGCTASACVTITQPAAFVVQINSSTNVSCYGSSDGAALAEATGGTQPYKYNWSDGQTTALAGNLTEGVFSITVTDFNGCTDVDQVTITEPADLSLVTAATDANCSQSDGAVSVSATGGTGTFKYKWNDPSSSTTQTVSGLAAGVFTVTVTDDNGCTKIAYAAINNISGPVIDELTITHVTCHGVCDGIASLTVSGGSGNYTFAWSDGKTTQSVSGLCAGDYNVTVTDGSGCKASSVFKITEPDELITTVTTVDESSTGMKDGTASVSVTGGTQPYTFKWDDPSSQTTQTATGLSTGWYHVTVTDLNLCTKIDSGFVDLGIFIAEREPGSYKLYPNPTSGQVFIELTDMTVEKVEVYDASGRMLLTQDNTGNIILLNITHFRPGTYFVRLVSGKQVYHQKIILHNKF